MKEKYQTIVREEVDGAKKLFHANKKFFFLTFFFFLCFAAAQIFLFLQILHLFDVIFVARSIGALSEIVSTSIWKVSFASVLFFLLRFFADSFRGIARIFGLRLYQIVTSFFYGGIFILSFPVLGLVLFLLAGISIALSSTRYSIAILPVTFLFTAITLNRVIELFIYQAIDLETFLFSLGAFFAFLVSIHFVPQK